MPDPELAARRAELARLLQSDLRDIKKRLDAERRIRQLKSGRAVPRTAAEQELFDAGVARRAKKLERARRRAAQEDDRPQVEPLDLDQLLSSESE